MCYSHAIIFPIERRSCPTFCTPLLAPLGFRVGPSQRGCVHTVPAPLRITRTHQTHVRLTRISTARDPPPPAQPWLAGLQVCGEGGVAGNVLMTVQALPTACEILFSVHRRNKNRGGPPQAIDYYFRGPEQHPRPVGSDPRVNSGASRRAWQGGLWVNKSGTQGLTTWHPLVWRVLNPFLILVCPDSNLLEGFWALVFF